MENEKRNTVDITNVSDLVLEAFLALKVGDDSFDFDVLSRRDLISLQKMAADVNLSGWIQHATYREYTARLASRPGLDFEVLILEAQEDDGRNVG